MNPIILSVIALAIGGFAGYIGRLFEMKAKKESLDLDVKKVLLEAKEKATIITDTAQSKIEKQKETFVGEITEAKKELREERERLNKREDIIEKRQDDVDGRFKDLENEVSAVAQDREFIEELKDKAEEKIEKIAQLTQDEAKKQLITTIEKNYSEDLLVRMRKLEDENNEKLHKRGQEIITTIIHRLASSTASDITTTSIDIPSEETKGKIIGKEGRNIRAFERIAGVELIIEETLNITISSFDPIRRQVARVALENLIADGRVQPAKIEEFVEKAQKEINAITRKKGQEAVAQTGIFNLDPRIIGILGRLHFRTSYGQNVLHHSIEMAHLAGMLAEELGADVQIAKAGALVHDIGKALDHEINGTHIDIGIRILEKFGADPLIVTAMKSHHDDFPHETVEAVIVQICDMISGSRPGARRDTLERYIKRLQDLEAIAKKEKGVEKVYALSAGREIRVFVSPKHINDFAAKKLAKTIAHNIERDLKYPGEIKVHVIRENRIVEYAR